MDRRLIILSGVPLAGKNHTAKQLLSLFDDCVWFDVDDFRNMIDRDRRLGGEVKLLEPNKEKAIVADSYWAMCAAAGTLAVSRTVIVSGTFSRREFKAPLKNLVDLMKERSVKINTFLLEAKDEIEIERRIAKRKSMGSKSNIDTIEKYRHALSFFGPIDFINVVRIDTTEAGCIEEIKRRLSGEAIR